MREWTGDSLPRLLVLIGSDHLPESLVFREKIEVKERPDELQRSTTWAMRVVT